MDRSRGAALAAAVAFLALAARPVHADIDLTVVKSGAPNQLLLTWTPGTPPYDVHREADRFDLPALPSPAVRVAGTSYLLTDGTPLSYYLVTCATGRACPPAPPESCANGADDDFDGLLDCADPDCSADPACQPACSNGRIDSPEECDDGNLVDFDGCSSACLNEVPPACGDGILQAGEECDSGAANSDTAEGACRQGCLAAACGDGVVDRALGEECDDGGTTPGDRCDATCLIESTPSCGDGTLDLALGEECDDAGTAAGDGCSPTCQLEPVGATCGDTTQDPDEACDDGGVANGDNCNPTCNLTNSTSPFAGSPGQPGLQDGVGTNARFAGTYVIAVDATSVWMAGNNVVRRVDIATGDVQTIAGDATAGAPGWVDDPIGLNARFAGIEAIATDGATVWIGDGANHRIRAVATTFPHAVTTVAGDGTAAHVDGFGTAASLDGVRGLTYFAGHVYLVDPAAATLRRFDPVSGEVLTLAGTAYATGTTDGFGTAARFMSPRYMTSDNSGVLHVADTNGATIRSYNTVTTFVGTFAGSGTVGYLDGIGTAALIHRPRGMTSDGSSVYWVEANQHAIRQGVLATASVTTLAGQHCGGAAPCAGGYAEGVGTAAQFNVPFSIAFHFPSGSLFVYDSGNNVLRQVR